MDSMTRYGIFGFTATTAVLCYAAFDEPFHQTEYSYDAITSAEQYPGQYDQYILNEESYISISDQIQILHQFSSSLLGSMKDIDPEYSALVDEKFWELI